MKLHSNVLQASDVYAAGQYAAKVSGAAVYVEAMTVGSRSHARGLELHLSSDGTLTRRRTNAGTSYPSRDGAGTDYAATWDQWGLVFAYLFAKDPAMVAGTVKRPVYRDVSDFDYQTATRFVVGEPITLHDHRWISGLPFVQTCKCGASKRWH